VKRILPTLSHRPEVVGAIVLLLVSHLLFDVRIRVVSEHEEPLFALGQVADRRRPTEAVPLRMKRLDGLGLPR